MKMTAIEIFGNPMNSKIGSEVPSKNKLIKKKS
jgi:hypothetical protein